MADNVVANPGVGGATFASDDIGGVQFPRTKISLGVDGANDGDVSSSNPMPVGVVGTVPVSGTVGISGTVPVSGAVSVTGSMVAVAGTVSVADSNLDVLLSTRLKPADTLAGVSTVGAVTAITNPVAVTNANLDVALSTRLKPADTLAGVTTVAAVTAITNPVTVAQATAANLKVDLSGTGANATALKVDGSAVTQPVSGTVNPSHDVNRTAISLYATGIAAGATGVETAITLTKSAGTGATTSAVSFVITNGKKFRITAISVASRGHLTATAQISTFNLRVNAAGAVGTSSTPIVMALRSATPATALAWDRVMMMMPEGFEIAGDGTLQIGITANAVFTTNAPTWDVNIVGYEY